MRKLFGAASSFCLIVLHAPDGSDLTVQTPQIVALRPVENAVKQHVAPGSKTVVITSAQTFAVLENITQIEILMECHELDDKQQ